MTITSWHYQSAPIEPDCLPNGAIGFIYSITNLVDSRIYYGKKKLTFKKTRYKMVTLKNGTKKKKKIATNVPSDWESYYGSSDELNEDVARLGCENFKRDILMFCYNLSDLSYQESRIQFVTDCLLYPNKYYNSWISCRVRRQNLL